MRDTALVLSLLLATAATAGVPDPKPAATTVSVAVSPDAELVELFGKDDNAEDVKFAETAGETLGKDADGSEIKFRIRLEPSGQLSFGGVDGPTVDPWGVYSFVVRLTPAADGTGVDATVADRWGRTVWRVVRTVPGRVEEMDVRASRVLDFAVSE